MMRMTPRNPPLKIMKQTEVQIKKDSKPPDFALWGIGVLWVMLVFMFIVFVGVMFSECMSTTFGGWFGIKEVESETPKHETLKFIGYIIGGLLAAIGGIAINRRASAQVKNNELVRKGNDDVRFQNVITGLGNEKAAVRIATFYRFYYLAEKEEQKKKFRKDVFEILCSCLRSISNDTSNAIKNKPEDEERIFRTERIERQALCDVLFRGKFKGNENKSQDLVSPEITADLKWADLTRLNLPNADFSGADLSGARLSGANLWYTDLSNTKLVRANFSDAIFDQTDFSDANLSFAIFSGAIPLKTQLEKIHSIKKADFTGAKVGNRAISHEDLPTNKGRYIAPWANDEFWEQIEKDEKNTV